MLAEFETGSKVDLDAPKPAQSNASGADLACTQHSRAPNLTARVAVGSVTRYPAAR